MDGQVQNALAKDGVIDITTHGRKTGEPRRIEIALWAVQGGNAITGRPTRPRSWYANLLANPEFTLHLKHGVQADLAARATPVTDPEERRRLLTEIVGRVGPEIPLEEWLEKSPLVRVEIL